MIRTQCSAYCQCEFCKQRAHAKPTETTSRLELTGSNILSKDALYYQSLKNSMKAQSFKQSQKNASRFVPDEQLLSSQKKRDAKDCALLAASVPLRRRDHLEELLILENKSRLKEEKRLRAERHALGLSDSDSNTPEEKEAAKPAAGAKPPTPVGERRATPATTVATTCSAEHDLQDVLGRIRTIANAEPAGGKEPLTQQQIQQLRALVREQEQKSREQVARCPHSQSHLCDHCMSINVQARHLCPQLADSVAFAQTGKVINQEEGVYYGTTAPRRLDGTYDATEGTQLAATLTASQKRLGNSYNPHPYGSGLVFLPLGDSNKPKEKKNVAFDMSGSSNTTAPKVSKVEATPADSSMDKYKTVSSMWQSTNQSRNAEMERFMESQKKLQENSRKAKQVDPNRAAAVAKGNLSSKDKPKENNYFYYKKEQERERREEDDGSVSSESSEGSRGVAPAPRQRAASAAATTDAAAKKSAHKHTDSDVDSDQELLEAARRRTELFLFPPSEKNYKAPTKRENKRLLNYELTKQKREEEEEAAAAAAAELPSEQEQTDGGGVLAPSTKDTTRARPGMSSDTKEVGSVAVRRASMSAATTATATTTTTSVAPSGADDRTPVQKDFDRLLLLFEDDIRREDAINYKRRKSATESSSDVPAKRTEETVLRDKLTYRVPARTFHELQDEAMHQIYEAWNEQHGDDETATFVSTDHTAEAFTLAVQLASQTHGAANLSAMPFTLEEIASLESGGRRSGRSNVAQEAQARLDRFMRSVYWVERLVRDETFVTELGNFFYAHHKVFLKHLTSAKDSEHTGKSSSIVEHSHEEFGVYAAYSARASDILWRLLSSKVRSFDDDEFVEALYNTPVLPEDREGSAMDGPQNVLSFLAWRFVLSISDFEPFFAWMMDYIVEEYNVDGDDDKKVVVAGARGLRALLHGKEDRKPTNAEQQPDVEEEQLFAEKAEANLSNSPTGAITAALASPPARVEASTPSAQPDFTMKSTRLLPFRKDKKPPHYLPGDPSITQSVSSLPRDVEASTSFSYPTPPASADGKRPISVQRATDGRHLPPLKEGDAASPETAPRKEEDGDAAVAAPPTSAAADEGSAKKKKKLVLATASPGDAARAKRPGVTAASTTLSANRRGSKTSTTTTTTTTGATGAARGSAGSTSAGTRASAASKLNFSASAPVKRTAGTAGVTTTATGTAGTGAVKPKPKHARQ